MLTGMTEEKLLISSIIHPSPSPVCVSVHQAVHAQLGIHLWHRSVHACMGVTSSQPDQSSR